MSLKTTLDKSLRQRIGLRCRGARRGLEIPAKVAAKMLGVTKPAVYMLENGTSGPSVETIVKLCRLYNVSADWLLCLID